MVAPDPGTLPSHGVHPHVAPGVPLIGTQRCQGGQYPPQTGAPVPRHSVPSGTHAQPPVASGRQVAPVVQNPLHAGAVALPHVTVGTTQMQLAPPAALTHSSPSGQTPPHTGAAVLPHAGASGWQMHAVCVAFGAHVVPGTHSPAQAGAAALPQGIVPETQTHPAGPSSQNEPEGQTPPHSGAELLPHGTP